VKVVVGYYTGKAVDCGSDFDHTATTHLHVLHHGLCRDIVYIFNFIRT